MQWVFQLMPSLALDLFNPALWLSGRIIKMEFLEEWQSSLAQNTWGGEGQGGVGERGMSVFITGPHCSQMDLLFFILEHKGLFLSETL